MIRKFQKPLARQLFEAINIDKKNNCVNLNFKSEYFRHDIKKITMTRDEQQCNFCGKCEINKHELQNHIKKFHERLQCSKCPYISFGETDLKQHEKNKHS